MQKADISNDRLTTFLANAREARHSFFRNPIVNQVEQHLIRERLHRGSTDNIGRVLTTEPVKSMASRAFRLEDILSPQSGFSAGVGSSLSGFWQRILLAAPKKISTNPNVRTIRQVPLRENSFAGIGDIGR